MRIRYKFLAFALAVLMIAGLVPFSLFAVGADSETKTQTREEYVAANGGTMLFGTSFDDASKISGARVNSSTSGGGYVDRASASADNGNTKVWVDTKLGAMRLVSGNTAADFWPFFQTSAAQGDNLVVEVSFKYDKQIPGEDNLMYSIYDFGSVKIRPRLVAVRPLEGNKIGLLLGQSTEVCYEFALGETVNLSFVIEPYTKRIHGYVDGKYIDTGVLHAGFDQIPASEGTYPKFQNVRMFQISGKKNQDISVFDLYVYSNVEFPYGAKSTHKNDIGYYAEKNGAKILNYYDFEDVDNSGNAYRYTPDKTEIDYTGDRRKLDDIKNGNGQSYLIRTPDWEKNLQIIPKYASILINKEENNNDYLRLEAVPPKAADAFFDTYQRSSARMKHEAGDIIVIHRSFRRSVSGNVGFALMNFKNRSYTTNNGNLDVGMLEMTVNGDIRITNSNAQDKGKVLGQVKTDEFTQVDVILDVANNKFAVAIDGVIVSKDNTLLSEANITAVRGKQGSSWTTASYCPEEIRTACWGGNYAKGYLDCDNLFVYCGKNLSTTNFFGYSNNVYKNEWVKTETGYWRYYDENGMMALGTKEIGGRTYYFDGNGYFSTLEREALVDFNSVTTGNDFAYGMAGMPLGGGNGFALAASGDVTARGWRYSALWGNMFYEGYKGHGNNLYNIRYNNKTYNGGAFTIDATNAAINQAFVRAISEAEAKALTDTRYPNNANSTVATGTKVFDFTGYQGIEIDWFTDKSIDMRLQAMAYNLQRDVRSSSDVRDAYYKYPFALNPQNGVTKTGWNTTVLDLTFGQKWNSGNPPTQVSGNTNSHMTIGGAQLSDTADGWRCNYVKRFQFDLTWDQANQNYDLDNVKLYIGSISLVKYSPVKSDVRPDQLEAVRRENGKTVVYGNNMSNPATGWTEVGSDTYYCLPGGIAVTGAYEIIGTVYNFDDNGKLLGNADGIYTIDGKQYYYKDGVRQMGEFTGVLYNGKSYSFNTKGSGEIVNLKYIIPGYTAGTYSKPDYSVIADADLLVKADFENLPSATISGSNVQVPYLGAVWGLTSGYNIAKKGTLNAAIKRSRFYYVEESAGDYALKTYNEIVNTDSFMDLDVASTANIVVEGSFKLGTDWNTKSALFEIQDRNGKNQSVPGITLNEQGYIKFEGVILGRLDTESYTRISVAHVDSEGENGTLHIYINGVEVYTYAITNRNFDKPTKFRLMHYNNNDNPSHGSMYINDVYAYVGTEPIEVDTAYEVRNGLYSDGDIKRLYKDGHILVGSQMIEEGVYGYFDTENGAMFDGNGFIDGKYYENGIRQNYTGIREIDGVKYFFDENNTIVKNKKYQPDPENPNKAYHIGADGVVTAELYKGEVISTAGTELGNAEGDAFDANSGTFVYDTELGMMVYRNTFNKQINLFTFDAPVDLSKYVSLDLKIYISEYYKEKGATFGIFFGQNMDYFKMEGVQINGNTVTYTSVASKPNPEINTISGLRDTGKWAGKYKVYQLTSTGEYYGRVWNYTGMPSDVNYPYVYNLKNYEQGWATISIPLSNYDQNFLKSVSQVRIQSTGWAFGTLNNGIDLRNNEIKLADATFVTYDSIDNEKNGWIDGRYYKNGEMQFGWFDYEGVKYYLDPVTGLKATGVAYVPTLTARSSAKTYCDFGTVGAYQGVADGIYETTSTVYNADTKSFDTVTVRRIYEDGEIVTGVRKIDGKTYYSDASYVVLANTLVKADVDGDGTEELVYLGSDGSVSQVFGQWVEYDGNDYYYDETGSYASGYTMIAGEYYYFDPANGNALVKDAWVEVYGVRMYFGADGKAPTGIVTITGAESVDNLMYFIDGVPTSTEFIKDGYKYKFDMSGLCTEKTPMSAEAPELLIWVVKDGIKTPFYFQVTVGEGFTKKFESFPCYAMIILDENGNEVEFEDNTLALINITVSATYTVKYKPLAHEYNEGYVAVEPGCGTCGEMRFVCKNCGSYYSESIPATGKHEFEEWEVILEPTCTFVGIKRHTCKYCGVKETEDIPKDPNNHVIEEWETIEYPTCTEEGVKAGVCVHCKIHLAHVTIPKLDHVYTTWTVDTAPTCITKGREISYCDNCHGAAKYRDIPKDPSAHNENKLVLFQTVVYPTCSRTGVGTYRCTDCGQFVYDHVIPVDPNAHVWDEGTIANPDVNCGYDVEKIYHCTEAGCGATKTEIIPANSNHDIDFSTLHYTTDPEDPLYGKHYYLCSKCQKAFEVTEHVMNNITPVNSTIHRISCDCGYFYDEVCEYILVKGDDNNHWYECKCGNIRNTEAHNFVAKYDNEKHWEECTVCEKIRNSAAHDIEEFAKLDSTCTAVGHEAYSKCKHCEYYPVEKVEIPMKPHNITAEYFHDETTHWNACVNCGFKHIIQEHSWVDVEAQEATCTENGWNAHRYCTICGYAPDRVTIEALGHDVAGQIMHFDDNEHWQICKRCSERVLEAHIYNEADYTDYDDEEGTANVKCEICDHEKQVTDLMTWWKKLGLERQGTALENYTYTYTPAGETECVKDVIVKFNDGSYRYFDDNGHLVRSTFSKNATFDKIVSFIDGDDIIAGLTAKDGERGAIKVAVIDTAEGIFKLNNGEIETGWITLENGKSYFFYSSEFYGTDNPYTAKKEGVLLTPDDPAAANLTILALDRKNEIIVICNVEADGAHLIGVVENSDGTANLYLDGTAGKQQGGIITDTYTNKVYYVLNGVLMKGNRLIGDIYYVFSDDYILDRMCRNEIIDFNGTTVYVNNEGKKAVNEWIKIGVDEYYLDADNKPVTGNFKLISGIYYDFDADGKSVGRSTGLINNNDGTVNYVFDGTKQISKFCEIDGNVYYFDVNGNMLVATEITDGLGNKVTVDTYYIDGKVYKVKADGTVTDITGNGATFVYFLTGGRGYFDGAELTKGLKELEAGLYYFDEVSGVMAINKTIVIGDIKYYFNLEGIGNEVIDD